MFSTEKLRLTLAEWLYPEMPRLMAEARALTFALATLQDELADRKKSNDDLISRAASAGLKLSNARDALKRALPYVQEDYADAHMRLQKTSLRSKNRPVLISVVTSISDDLSAIVSAANGVDK